MNGILMSVCGDAIVGIDETNWNQVLAPGVDENHIYRCVCGTMQYESLHDHISPSGWNVMPGVSLLCPHCKSTIELRLRDGINKEYIADENRVRQFNNRHMTRLFERKERIKEEFRTNAGNKQFSGLVVLELIDRAMNDIPPEGESTSDERALYEDICKLLNKNKEV